MGEPSHTLFEGEYLRLVRRGRWEFAERVTERGAVAIVAVTPAGGLLLVEQFRAPLNARVIELPAGLIGDSAELAGESWQASAARELEEETGFRARRFEALIDGPTTPGLSNENVVLARAFDLEKTGVGGGDAHEDITVHEVDTDRAHAWLQDRAAAGVQVDVKVYAGLYFLNAR